MTFDRLTPLFGLLLNIPQQQTSLKEMIQASLMDPIPFCIFCKNYSLLYRLLQNLLLTRVPVIH